MSNFNTRTDWVFNQNNKAALVDHHADGDEVITLERFLADSPNNTPEMFAALKAESDAIFEAEDNAARECGENEIPLYDWSGKCATPSLEDELFGDGGESERNANLERREKLFALLPAAMDKLSPTQLRRLLLHRRDGLTTREIAEQEGCSHQSVVESLQAADKKIKKFLAKG
jgi:DNA-binding CsgD family transcriptional regulator